jgi:hypothetical protein
MPTMSDASDQDLAVVLTKINRALNRYQTHLDTLAANPGEHNRPAAEKALQQFSHAIAAAGIGGYEIQWGSLAIPWLPGGTAQDGSVRADFTSRIASINNYAQSIVRPRAGAQADPARPGQTDAGATPARDLTTADAVVFGNLLGARPQPPSNLLD